LENDHENPPRCFRRPDRVRAFRFGASADEAMTTSHRHADMDMRADASKPDASQGDVDAAIADWHKNFGF